MKFYLTEPCRGRRQGVRRLEAGGKGVEVGEWRGGGRGRRAEGRNVEARAGGRGEGKREEIKCFVHSTAHSLHRTRVLTMQEAHCS